MMKTIKYKEKEYQIKDFVTLVKDMPKQEFIDIITNKEYTKVLAQYLKEHPEHLKKRKPVSV